MAPERTELHGTAATTLTAETVGPRADGITTVSADAVAEDDLRAAVDAHDPDPDYQDPERVEPSDPLEDFDAEITKIQGLSSDSDRLDALLELLGGNRGTARAAVVRRDA